ALATAAKTASAVRNNVSKPAVREAPDCGLYIAVPPLFKVDELMPQLRQIFLVTKSSPYKMNMHVLEIAHEVDEFDFSERAAVITALGRAAGFVVVLRGKGAAAAWQAQKMEADGVLLDELTDIAPVRDILGADAIIGLRCGLSPERADEAQEAGVDYVTFGYPDRRQLPPEDVVKLWAWRDDTPVVVEGPLTNDEIDDFIKAGATFFDASTYIWDHPEGVMQGTVNMLYAIDLALGVQS
ncbi:MAG: thiamine phosphate synthase, partial [Alphaproteobacteria bacterium]|nr:thiamine phosphate synthase [Alphaproteobacteria bacterium]